MINKKVSSYSFKIFFLAIVAGVAGLGIQSTFAAIGVSNLLSYQGRLTNTAGDASTGPFCFKFSIYTAASGGTKVWPAAAPSTMSATVTNGVFNVGIGDTSIGGDSLLNSNWNPSYPNGFADIDTTYLNIDVASRVGATCAVGDGAEVFETLTPRQRIDATAYARVAYSVYGGDVQVGDVSGTSGKLLKLAWKNTPDALGGPCSGSGATLGSLWFNSNTGFARVCNSNIIKSLSGLTNDFFDIAGPSTTAKTFTFPNVSANVLTSANLVTVAQGGTGTSTLIANNVILGNGTNAPLFIAPGALGNVLTSNGTTWVSQAGGGGGTPGGADTQIQYNNAGAFGGNADFTWNNTTKDLTLSGVDTGITLNGITNEPAAPAAGDVHLYTKNVGGRMLPKWIGPSGVDVAVQPALFGNNIALWVPSTGTTASLAFGTTWTARNSGTSAAQSTPTIAATNLSTSMKRACFGTGSTTTGSSGTQSSQLLAWRGNAVGLGGFFFFARVAVDSTYVNTVRMMTGLSGQNASLNAQPSTINNSIFLGKDSADTTWQIMIKGTGAVTKINTGVTIASGQVMDLYINARPNDNKITIRLVQQLAGSQTVIINNVDYIEPTYNLPANNVFLYAWHAIQSTVGTTAKLYCLNRIYVESDI